MPELKLTGPHTASFAQAVLEAPLPRDEKISFLGQLGASLSDAGNDGLLTDCLALSIAKYAVGHSNNAPAFAPHIDPLADAVSATFRRVIRQLDQSNRDAPLVDILQVLQEKAKEGDVNVQKAARYYIDYIIDRKPVLAEKLNPELQIAVLPIILRKFPLGGNKL